MEQPTNANHPDTVQKDQKRVLSRQVSWILHIMFVGFEEAVVGLAKFEAP